VVMEVIAGGGIQSIVTIERASTERARALDGLEHQKTLIFIINQETTVKLETLHIYMSQLLHPSDSKRRMPAGAICIAHETQFRL
jgi:hypothetical protein